jgi:hypothetical protein
MHHVNYDMYACIGDLECVVWYAAASKLGMHDCNVTILRTMSLVPQHMYVSRSISQLDVPNIWNPSHQLTQLTRRMTSQTQQIDLWLPRKKKAKGRYQLWVHHIFCRRPKS